MFITFLCVRNFTVIKLTPASLGLSQDYKQSVYWVSPGEPYKSKFTLVIVGRIQSGTKELSGCWADAAPSYLPLVSLYGAAHHMADGFFTMIKWEPEMVSSTWKSQSFVTKSPSIIFLLILFVRSKSLYWDKTQEEGFTEGRVYKNFKIPLKEVIEKFTLTVISHNLKIYAQIIVKQVNTISRKIGNILRKFIKSRLK